jgi:hyperosmotically inducible periplasmic protein
MSRLLSWSMLCVLVLGLTVSAQTTKQQPPAPDNTKINKRDKDPSQPTAGQQKENRPDRETTRLIRRAITEDKDLSTYAKNIKIVTQNGNVTLRGPVRSEEEKKTIEAKANAIAGDGHVRNEIEIAAAKETKKKNP